jgi:hypothetical protein
LAPAVVVVAAVVVLDLELVLVVLLPAALLPVVALVVLLLQFPSRLLREAQLLRPVLQPEVAAALRVPLPQQPEVAAVAVAAVLVQGLVASEILRSR